jgi:hypothetical protein
MSAETRIDSTTPRYQTFEVIEEFVAYSADPASVGDGWRTFDAVGTGSYAIVAASGSAWGVVSITTGAASGDGRHLGLGTVSANGAIDDLGTIAPWEAWFRFNISATTSVIALVGFLSNPFGIETTCDQITLRFDTASDTTFKVLCRASGTSTVTDTTVTPVASTYYSLRIWSDVAGTIKFRIYSAVGAPVGVEVSISTNVPGTVMTPDFFIGTRTTAARTLSADTFRMFATLAR